jgi:hypothetical protein
MSHSSNSFPVFVTTGSVRISKQTTFQTIVNLSRRSRDGATVPISEQVGNRRMNVRLEDALESIRISSWGVAQLDCTPALGAPVASNRSVVSVLLS